MPTVTETKPQSAQTQEKPAIGDFGAGRYSSEMKLVFEGLQSLFGLKPEVSDRIARQYGSDIGAIMRNMPVEVKLKVTGKDMDKLNIRELSKVKGIIVTNTMLVRNAIQWIDDAFKNGVSRKSGWKFSPALQKYIDDEIKKVEDEAAEALKATPAKP